MYYGANQVIMEMAKALMKELTPTESILWDRLNNRKLLKVRFRRQHPIYNFIADFYCHTTRLVVEVDGEIHNDRMEYDEGRTAEIERFGIKVIRFGNDEVENNIENVIHKIEEIVRIRLEKMIFKMKPKNYEKNHQTSTAPEVPLGGFRGKTNIKPALLQKSPLGDLGVKHRKTSTAPKVLPGGFRGKTA